MGWCNGSYIANDVFEKICSTMNPTVEEKRKIASYIYERFCDEDADCWDEDLEIMKYVEETD